MASTSARAPRPAPAYSTLPDLASSFVLQARTRSYAHQYANMYFARLVQLREAVRARAEAKWGKAAGASLAPTSRRRSLTDACLPSG